MTTPKTTTPPGMTEYHEYAVGHGTMRLRPYARIHSVNLLIGGMLMEAVNREVFMARAYSLTPELNAWRVDMAEQLFADHPGFNIPDGIGETERKRLANERAVLYKTIIDEGDHELLAVALNHRQPGDIERIHTMKQICPPCAEIIDAISIMEAAS